MAQSQYGGRSDFADKASDLKDQATGQIKRYNAFIFYY